MRLLSGRGVRALAYAPGPQPLLAAAGDDRAVRLWDPVTGEAREPIPGTDSFLCLAFSPDGQWIAAGGRGGALVAYDADSRQGETGGLAPGPVVALSFTRDGRALLGAVRSHARGTTQHFDGGRLVCYNREPPQPLCPLEWSGDLESAAFSPARDLLAIAGHNRGVEFLEVGRPRNEPAFWMPGRIRSLTFSGGEGRYLAVAGGRTVGVWDVEGRQWRSQCAGHRGDVNALAFSPDGLTLLSGGMDRSVRLWETLSGRQLAAWEWKVGVVNALAYATDGMTAAAAGDKQVVVWDVDEG
jgi:WD40 repeat protein